MGSTSRLLNPNTRTRDNDLSHEERVIVLLTLVALNQELDRARGVRVDAKQKALALLTSNIN
jgi:hypothetical protein